jgi:hypothetical protein
MFMDYITPDQFYEGIIYCVIIAAGLFVLLLFIALICLMAVNPKCPDHMRRIKP